MSTNVSKWIDNYNTIQTSYQNYRQLGNCSSDCNTSCPDGFETDGTVVSGNNCNLNLISNPDGSVSYTRGCQASCKYTNDKITSLMATWVQNNPLPLTTIVEESDQCKNATNSQLRNSCSCQNSLLQLQGEISLYGQKNKKYNLDTQTYNTFLKNSLDWTDRYNTEKNTYSNQRKIGSCETAGFCNNSSCDNGWIQDGSGTVTCDIFFGGGGCAKQCKPDDNSISTHMQQWIKDNPIIDPISQFDNSTICVHSFDNNYNVSCNPSPTLPTTPINNVNIQCCSINFDNNTISNISNVVNNCIQNVGSSISENVSSVPDSVFTSTPTSISTPSPISTPSTSSTQTFGEKFISFITNKWFLLGLIISIVIITIIITVLKIYN